jgi:hypothetical protein
MHSRASVEPAAAAKTPATPAVSVGGEAEAAATPKTAPSKPSKARVRKGAKDKDKDKARDPLGLLVEEEGAGVKKGRAKPPPAKRARRSKA